MTHRLASFASAFLAAVLVAVCVPAMSQGTAPAPTAADAWPREIRVDSGSVLLHQPQVNTWDGMALDFRAVVEVKAATSGKDTFGVVWATARTLIDRQDRMVTLQGLKFTRAKFPALPDNGTALLASLQKSVDATPPRPVSLDRLQASLTAAKDQHPAGVVVANTPPRIIVSNTPALLVSIDGTPVVKAAGSSRFERVINTRALILKLRETWYLHVYDGWMSADNLDGPWTSARAPLGANDVAQTLAKSGTVDLLDGGPNAKPKPTLAAGAPAIYVSQVPAELIVFTGAPDFAPISQTTLLWATNAQGDVFVDTTDNSYYVLLSGRWYRGSGLNGPWAYVAHNALPPSFARIPPGSLAGVVLASVAGTPQAQEAVIASQIPQTATVPRQGGPKFAPTFDGAAVLRPIDGTPLSYVANTPAPIIRVDASTFYGVQAGVWFAASAVTGPWVVAAQVPEVIYTIPPSSPLHYVTYVRIYETTPTVVYTGYTPGYYGSVVTASGVVVYGTGYAYSPWVGSVYYPFPLTYGLGAYPVYNPAVGFAFGFAFGAAYASWYHPAYYGMPCCGAYGASANVYRSWGNTVSSGTRSWYSGNGTAGTRAAGGYANARTGTTGTYSAGRSVDAWSGTAQQGYNRTYNTATGASGSTSRGERYDADTGVHSYGSSTSVTGAGGGSVDRNVAAAAAGPAGGTAAARQTTVDNARTGQSNTFGSAKVGDSHFASVDGNVYRNSGDGWEQHNPQSGGWGQAGGDTSWAQRESQARSASESRFSSFQGGGGFGGGRFGGFGGGGFRGRR